MSSPRLRRAVAPALLVLALAACGRGNPDQSLRTGSTGQDAGGSFGPAASTTEGPADPSGATTTTATPSTTGDASASTTSTSVAVGTEGEPPGSIVEGLSPTEVQAAVAAPVAASTRRLAGPTLEQLTLPSGTTVWRVRIPGRFAARSARVTVSVGDRLVGTGVVGRSLDTLVGLTTDGRGLTAGAPVSYRWEGSDAVAAGRLAVVR